MAHGRSSQCFLIPAGRNDENSPLVTIGDSVCFVPNYMLERKLKNSGAHLSCHWLMSKQKKQDARKARTPDGTFPRPSAMSKKYFHSRVLSAPTTNDDAVKYCVVLENSGIGHFNLVVRQAAANSTGAVGGQAAPPGHWSDEQIGGFAYTCVILGLFSLVMLLLMVRSTKEEDCDSRIGEVREVTLS